MSRRVLSVGQCDPDHASISQFLTTSFDVAVDRADDAADALAAMQEREYGLVLVNRVFDADGDDGLALIRRLGMDEKQTPVMLVSNYPDWQERAGKLGARPGFGKADLGRPEVVERLRPFLAAGEAV